MTIDFDDELTAPFWQAAAQQELVLSWCEACDKAVWYPRSSCPACGGALHWQRLCGDASLFSWSVVRKPINPLYEPPYIPALVVPREAPGVRLVTQLVDCDAEALRCDMPLRVRFRTLRPRNAKEFVAPLFVPA